MEQNFSVKYRQCAEIYGRITGRYLELDLALSSQQIDLALQRYGEVVKYVDEIIAVIIPEGTDICRITETEHQDHLARARAEVIRISIRKPTAPASEALELLMSQVNEMVCSQMHDSSDLKTDLERAERALESVSYLKAYIEAARS